MPYWNVGELHTDSKGVEIKPGDLLRHVDSAGACDPNYPWQFFICYTEDGHRLQVRDLIANNVAMCSLGEGGNVVNLGHYTEHPEVLGEDEIAYYFGEE